MEGSTRYEVAKQFSRFPGGRRRSHGAHSGEEFREDVVIPLLKQFEFVEFDLTGSAGYSSGFLDEAFGEIGEMLGLEEARRRIALLASDDEESIQIAWERIQDAARESKNR